LEGHLDPAICQHHRGRHGQLSRAERNCTSRAEQNCTT